MSNKRTFTQQQKEELVAEADSRGYGLVARDAARDVARDAARDVARDASLSFSRHLDFHLADALTFIWPTP